MWDYIKYKINLATLRRKEECISREFKAKLKLAKSNGKTHDEMQSIEHQMRFESSEMHYDIQELASLYMINIARRHFIPIPYRNNDEMWDERYGYKILSTSGINFIREKRAQQRAQEWSTYGSAMGAATGLVGAFAAVLALMK